MLRTRHLAALLALAPLAGAQQTLLVPETTNDVVMLFDAMDGSLVNPSFIDVGAVGGSNPIEAIAVGSELWVSDQFADAIYRFSLDGTTFLGSITGGLDNLRGLEHAGNVYQSNAGTGNGAPGDGVVVLDTSGAPVTTFSTGDPFDVKLYNGELLVSDSVQDDIERYALDGTFLGNFDDGTSGMSWPEQINVKSNGNLLIGTFLSDGIYELDPSGALVTSYDLMAIAGHDGIRGAFELGDGNILYTNDQGVHVLDPVGMTSTTVHAGVNARFITGEAGGAVGAAFCSGDGTGTACPCANTGGAGEGCANSTGAGARLSASGQASVANDSLALFGTNLVPGQPGLYFQGDNAVNGGAGAAFGDGLRCAGGAVVRLQVRTASAAGTSSTSAALGATGGVQAGQTKRYQLWYRDPAGSPCGTGFNLSNGLEVVWGP